MVWEAVLSSGRRYVRVRGRGTPNGAERFHAKQTKETKREHTAADHGRANSKKNPGVGQRDSQRFSWRTAASSKRAEGRSLFSDRPRTQHSRRSFLRLSRRLWLRTDRAFVGASAP